MAYVPHSLYYSPVHPPEFYGDEKNFLKKMYIQIVNNCVIVIIIDKIQLLS